MREKFIEDMGPGKFEGTSPFTVFLYELTLVSGEDEQLGNSVDGPAICWRLGRNVLIENSVGFVTRCKLDHKGQTLAEWCESNLPEVSSWEAQEGDVDADAWTFG